MSPETFHLRKDFKKAKFSSLIIFHKPFMKDPTLLLNVFYLPQGCDDLLEPFAHDWPAASTLQKNDSLF
jgi:hypothetical protein